MAAGRTIRRAPAAQAVPALLQAVSEHADGFIRFKALTLLTGYNDPRTADAMETALVSPERSAARGRLRVLRAEPSPCAPAEDGRCPRQGRRRVRPPRPGSGARRDAERTQGRRGVDSRRRARAGFFPQHRHRSDRRLQDRRGDSAPDRDREARWAAAGRCRNGAGKDRRQERPRHARRLAAVGAERGAAGDCRCHLPDGHELLGARRLSPEDADVRRHLSRLPGPAARRRRGTWATSPGKATRTR